jgi:neutral ceramidase
MSYQAGFSKVDMTSFFPGLGMMGYGQLHNTVKEVATPLWCRCLYLKCESEVLVLVHLEQAFVTIAIKSEILKRLPELSEKNLLVTAQHTHAAPGGYSHYPFYNFTIPNFQTRVFEKVVSSAVTAIEEAKKKLEAVDLTYGEHLIPEYKEVAFNRSMVALLNNPDAPKVKLEDRHLGVNRLMEALWIIDKKGQTKGMLNWFGVHATSISSYNQRIHHDNKGVAAQLFEEHYPGSTAFFLQSSAGDVSPNFIWNKSQNRMGGKYKDQYESAAYNGEIQFRESEKTRAEIPVSEKLSSFQNFFDMSKRAAAPAHGVGFFKGTLEGPGVSPALGLVMKGIARLTKTIVLIKDPGRQEFYKAHGRKDVLLDHARGQFVGMPLSLWKKLPTIPEPTLTEFQKVAKRGALETLPWIPAIIPFQIIRIGDLLLLTVPGEVTTMARERLETWVLQKLDDPTIKKILLTTYANGYMGYVTTPEEYDLQCYEGGHTVYGRHTLDAIMGAFGELIETSQGKTSPQLPPFQFPPEELARRSE